MDDKLEEIKDKQKMDDKLEEIKNKKKELGGNGYWVTILLISIKVIWGWWDIASDIIYILTIEMFSIDRLS